jgi:hypothetical protein
MASVLIRNIYCVYHILLYVVVLFLWEENNLVRDGRLRFIVKRQFLVFLIPQELVLVNIRLNG